MELVNSLFYFFGFENLALSATLPEFITWICRIGIGVWLVVFIISSLFLVIRAPELRF